MEAFYGNLIKHILNIFIAMRLYVFLQIKYMRKIGKAGIYQLPILAIPVHVIWFLLEKGLLLMMTFFIINSIVRQAWRNVMHCLIFTNILTYTTYKVEEHHDT